MKKLMSLLIVSTFVLGAFASAYAYEAIVGPTGVLKYDKQKAYDGYTLFSPMSNHTTTYLIDMEGYVVHTWKAKMRPGLHSMLLENGNLLIGQRPSQKFCGVGGTSGIVQELDWDGNVVWEYKMVTPGKEIQHHTFTRMPNGNTLILGWEYKPYDEVIAKGRDPKTFPKVFKYRDIVYKGMWVDFVREVNKAGESVWEWHAWDHVGTGPNQLDINYKLPDPVGGVYPHVDWTHFNTCDYIPSKDLLILNSRNISEFYLVNHKTGAIEYRWGNPSAYGAGKAPSWFDDGDQILFGPHNATYLDNGHMLIFDNGSERPQGNRSRAVEMDPETGKIVWEYATRDSSSFYTSRQGSAQRLPNGNTLITSTGHGHIFEVTYDKKVAWDYVIPMNNGKAECTLEDKTSNSTHRAYRYGKDYPGLKGKKLDPPRPLALGCPEFFRIYPAP